MVRLTIGALSRATGIPEATLRTWERRYGVPRSKRKRSGHRLYPPQTIDRLLAVRRAIAQGHRAAEILPLSRATVESWLDAAPARLAPQPGAVAQGPPGAVAQGPPAPDTLDPTDLVTLATPLDRGRFESRLHHRWTSLGPVAFLDQCASTLPARLAEARLAGTIAPRHEQFALARLGDVLRELRRSYDLRATGPAVVATTFPGDAQELELLMGSLAAAARGWRVTYLGPGSPLEEIATLAKEARLGAALFAVSERTPRAYALALVAKARGLLPESTSLWIAAHGLTEAARGAHVFESWDALDRHLGAT